MEFLHQGEDIALMPAQQIPQRVGRFRAAGVTVMVHQANTGVRLVDLGIQILAVRADQEGEIPAQTPVHLAGEEHHRVRLARTLGVPEHAELAVSGLALFDGPDRSVHAEELVVAREDLHGLPGAVVEDDEVLEQIQEVGLVADALKQSLHGHISGRRPPPAASTH
ncbi:MAG: hypothetical protein U5L11_16370 [Arhodomonas sp.]|nr:hypothetical protein [Arhodomonas sp.]